MTTVDSQWSRGSSLVTAIRSFCDDRVDGLTYSDQSHVFNRWILPSYQTSFLWTGNRPDAEDATAWVFKNGMGCCGCRSW